MHRLGSHKSTSLVAFFGVAVMLYWFHDQFWWPVDEGVYAYVAQRALAGDVLHRDLIDLHAGYGNLLNIWAFRLFGEDLLSLRYPLVALAFLQSVVAYVLLAPKGNLVAMTGALTVAAFSFIQFPNPSANWHALGAFFLLCLCLERLPRGTAARLLIAGLLVGVCFFTRQLSGVFLALGLITVLLAETSDRDTVRRGPALLIGGIIFSGLALYLFSKGHVFGFLWAGVCPLALIVLASLRARIDWREAGRTTAYVTLGFLLGGAPMALLALSQGAFGFWISDIFVTALLINGQDFIELASFATLLDIAIQTIVQGAGPVAIFSSIAWILLVMSVPVLGAATLYRMIFAKSVPASVILAVFWAVGALHYQIPIYLYYALPAVFFAFLMLLPGVKISATLLLLSAYMLIFQAGQPLERGLVGALQAVRAPANVHVSLPRVSLRIQAGDALIFEEVIAAIEQAARPGEPLMTLPMDPELNFMTGRKSPVRYYGTPLGLREPTQVATTLEALDQAAPLFVVHRRGDKYMAALSGKLLEHVRRYSDQPVSVGPFDLYRYQGSTSRVLSSAER